jgi:hypothetical protein
MGRPVNTTWHGDRGDIVESPIESRRLLVHDNSGRPAGRMPNGYREHAIANFLVK